MKDSIRILEYTVPAGEEGLSVRDIMKTVLGLSTKEIARCKHF